jgi:tRNA pseudouridine13 synthase
LKGNYEKAINIIMEPKPSESEFMALARKDWRNRFEKAEDKATAEQECAGRLVKSVNRNLNSSEVSVLNSLARYPLDYKRAYGCVQKTMRMMFLHAVQSYLWNHVASFRIDTLGRQVVKGDLVSASSDDKFAVKVVTEDDVTASRYRLEDVLLPMIGTKTKDPENLAGEQFDKLLEKMGLDRSAFKKLDEREFDLCGDYRTLICPSAELDYKVIEYTDTLQPLIQTDLMKIHGIEVEEAVNAEPEKVLLAMDVAFTLPSSTYATIALRELMKRPTSSEYQSELKLNNN